MNLTTLFEQHYCPKLIAKGRNKETIAEYRRTARCWDRILHSPDLEKITDAHLTDFKAGLAGLPGTDGMTMRQNTIRKYLRHLRPMLVMAGPKDSGNLRGLDLLSEIPDMNPPAEMYRGADDAFTREEILAWISTAGAWRAEPVCGIEASLWWTCFLAFMYNTGKRVGTLLNATWSWVNFENRTFTSIKQPGVKTGYTISLNQEAMTMLLRMQQVSSGGKLIFPWTMNRRTLYVHARKQQELAGIPKERQFGFHAIRKHFGSMLALQNKAAACKSLGHSSQGITDRYYVNRDQVATPFIEKIQPLFEPVTHVSRTSPKATAVPTSPINDYSDFCGSSVVGW